MRTSNKLIIKELEKIKVKFDKQIIQKKHQLNNRPGSELIDIYGEFKELLDSSTGEKRFTKEFSNKINYLHARDVKARKALKEFNPDKHGELIGEIVDLEAAVSELNTMFYYIKNPLR